MNEEKKPKHFILMVLVLILCILYLGAKVTYTTYESFINTQISTETAGILLKLNGVDLAESDTVLDNNLILDNITWTNTHTREGKLSPGSSGTINLELDPAGSEVAMLYIDCDQTLTQTGPDTYTGILTLNDVLNGTKVHLDVDFYFDYLTDIEGIEEDNQVLDDFFEIHFHAIQYQGESITPYSG